MELVSKDFSLVSHYDHHFFSLPSFLSRKKKCNLLKITKEGEVAFVVLPGPYRVEEESSPALLISGGTRVMACVLSSSARVLKNTLLTRSEWMEIASLQTYERFASFVLKYLDSVTNIHHADIDHLLEKHYEQSFLLLHSFACSNTQKEILTLANSEEILDFLVKFMESIWSKGSSGKVRQEGSQYMDATVRKNLRNCRNQQQALDVLREWSLMQKIFKYLNIYELTEIPRPSRGEHFRARFRAASVKVLQDLFDQLDEKTTAITRPVLQIIHDAALINLLMGGLTHKGALPRDWLAEWELSARFSHLKEASKLQDFVRGIARLPHFDHLQYSEDPDRIYAQLMALQWKALDRVFHNDDQDGLGFCFLMMKRLQTRVLKQLNARFRMKDKPAQGIAKKFIDYLLF